MMRSRTDKLRRTVFISRGRIGLLRCNTVLPLLSTLLLLQTWVQLLNYNGDPVVAPSSRNTGLVTLSSLKSVAVSSLPQRTNHSQWLVESNEEQRLVQHLSSVDYMACCGLGHRLTKMSDAHFVARHLNLALRSFWGYCDRIEVFHHLFGQQPSDELEHVTEFNRYLRLNNNVPGFRVLTRRNASSSRSNSSSDVCSCSMEKMHEDVRFYESLRKRFRFESKVRAFRERHFGDVNRTVVGLHIRAGNGETGDFQAKNRVIGDVDQWVLELSQRLLSKREWTNSILFVATDTPSMIDALRTLLGSHMTVVSLEQSRLEEGRGVLFGERSQVLDQGGAVCLSGWIDSLSDMVLLSHCDAVVAARPSSFTQSMPLSLVLGGEQQRHRPPTSRREFCELNRDATEMRCYSSLSDWCCSGTTSFSLEGIQGHDFLSQTSPDFGSRSHDARYYRLLDREDRGCTPRRPGKKQVCLPYDWSAFAAATPQH